MAIPLGRSSPSASCDRPERRREGSPGISDRSGMPAAPTWSCSRWGFPCHRRCRRRGALLPHRFTLTARPACRDGLAVYFLWHFPWGRPRRALPGTAPPWSPDFPLPADRGERPSDRLAPHDLGCRGASVKGSSAFEEAGQANPETISAGFDRIGRRAPHPDPLPESGARERAVRPLAPRERGEGEARPGDPRPHSTPLD